MGLTAGPSVYFFGGSEFLSPHNLTVVGNCHIGRLCQIDARGGISIGQDVVIASHALLITADHDIQAPGFDGRLGAITVEDRVWIGSRCVILKGVHLGEGAVVAAGSVVHRDVEPWTIVSGVPARAVGKRSPEQKYHIDRGPEWY
jgi:acetyltransferase-like isoleucine patch superfamily enzyme